MATSRWKPGISTNRTCRRLNATLAAMLVRLLVAGQPTLHDLVAQTGLSIMTVRAYVKALHLAGVCRIAGWEQDKRGAYMTPRWQFGSGGDEAKPPPLSQAVRMRAYRKVQKLRDAGFRPPTVAQMARAAA